MHLDRLGGSEKAMQRDGLCYVDHREPQKTLERVCEIINSIFLRNQLDKQILNEKQIKDMTTN